ncbi:hypothetical protein BV898_08891 [Hypsibius exemplaris]|uniref:EF-hand domain-containing protein n=1 Tax=Hypsibius exemplaris TaxID=2072580 RepID=A0A1W0WPC4_HYPEX|nr:hypothetical protein BV898_08891 [Hypsibius exemplaris]
MLRAGSPTSGLQGFDHKKAEDYAKAFLPFFDIDHDGKLGLNELARLLPSKENFVQLAVDKAFSFEALTAAEVQTLLGKYDKSVNGTLEGNELSAFVRDLLATGSDKFTAEDVRDLEKVILKTCDLDKNGSIDVKELALVIKSIANAKQKGGDGIYKFYHSRSDKK